MVKASAAFIARSSREYGWLRLERPVGFQGKVLKDEAREKVLGCVIDPKHIKRIVKA